MELGDVLREKSSLSVAEEGKADAETDLAVTSNSLAPPSATQSLLTTASRTAKQRACLAGTILVALTAAPAPASLLSCSGIPAVKATPSVESAAISCSAAEQAAISEISVSDFSDDRDRCCHTTLALTGISHDNSTGLAGAILVALTAQSTLASWPSCTGIPAAKATSCFESAAISCSAAEQAATQKMPASDLCDDCDWCGHTALTLTGISHDKLDGCSTAALGTRLSQTSPTRNGDFIFEVPVKGRTGRHKPLKWAMHIVCLPWQPLYAVLIPLNECWSGWPCSVVCIGHFLVLTACIIGTGEMFGCVAEINDSITAITLITIGTSMPDFVSSMAAVHHTHHDWDHSDCAGAAIINVLGSNSINVVLGLGFPWLITALHWSAVRAQSELHEDWLRRYLS